jgi:hypothetical protein
MNRLAAETYLDTSPRGARPGIAITTDLIVGYPTETEADFEQTLTLMNEVRVTDSYSFKYSERPGTPAQRHRLGELEDAVVQARLERVQDLQRQLTLDAHGARVGRRTEVLVEGSSRHGSGQLTGRCRHRVVNFTPPADLARQLSPRGVWRARRPAARVAAPVRAEKPSQRRQGRISKLEAHSGRLVRARGPPGADRGEIGSPGLLAIDDQLYFGAVEGVLSRRATRPRRRVREASPVQVRMRLIGSSIPLRPGPTLPGRSRGCERAGQLRRCSR